MTVLSDELKLLQSEIEERNLELPLLNYWKRVFETELLTGKSKFRNFFEIVFHFDKLLAACCQRYELDERLDTVEKASVVEVGDDVRETGRGVG